MNYKYQDLIAEVASLIRGAKPNTDAAQLQFKLTSAILDVNNFEFCLWVLNETRQDVARLSYSAASASDWCTTTRLVARAVVAADVAQFLTSLLVVERAQLVFPSTDTLVWFTQPRPTLAVCERPADFFDNTTYCFVPGGGAKLCLVGDIFTGELYDLVDLMYGPRTWIKPFFIKQTSVLDESFTAQELLCKLLYDPDPLLEVIDYGNENNKALLSYVSL